MEQDRNNFDETDGIAGDDSSQSGGKSDSGNGDSGNDSGNGRSGRSGRSDKRRAGNASDPGSATRAASIEKSDSEISVRIEEKPLFDEKPPKQITIDSVAKESKRGRKPGSKNTKKNTSDLLSVTMTLDDKQLSELIDWLFKIPKLYGWGDHWELTPKELKDLTEKTRAVLDLFPDSIIEKYIANGSKWFAPISLLMAVLTLVSAKYAETQLLKQYAEYASEFASENGTATNAGKAEQSENPASNGGAGWNGRGTGSNPFSDSPFDVGVFGSTK